MSQYVNSNIPKIRAKRSKFNLSNEYKTSCNVGDIIPFMWKEILPGDTFKVRSSHLERVISSFIKSPIDNAFMDVYFFHVPNRLLQDNWKEVMGENKKDPWAQKETHLVPQVKFDAGHGSGGDIEHYYVPKPGSLADYLGLPTFKDGDTPDADSTLPDVSQHPFRAYQLIYDEWFRDENLQDPLVFDTSSADVSYPFSDHIDGNPKDIFALRKANKIGDYFTNCLPAPQKGDAISIGLGDTAVITTPIDGTGNPGPIKFLDSNGKGYDTGLKTDGYGKLSGEDTSVEFSTTNMYTDLSSASAISINKLREAFALQRLYERDARGGTRYTEMIMNHFGVTPADSTIQRPEYLGGARSRLNINQVVQTSSEISQVQTTPQGNVAGYSLSGGNAGFTKSFVEHGILMGVFVIRHKHTYQQGIDRSWFKKDRLDYYDPVFNGIGEQPVYQKEIFGLQDVNKPNNVFGYNEAYAYLRRGVDKVTGQLRSGSGNMFDVWHFGDYYKNAPVLSSDFVQSIPDYFDRTISVSHDVANQFLVDIHNDVEVVRNMPLYSVPGGIGSID